MKQDFKLEKLIDETGTNLSLDEWLKKIHSTHKDKYFIDYMFANEKHYKEYIGSIDARTNEDVKKILIKFLLPEGHLQSDDQIRENLNLCSGKELKEKLNESLFLKKVFLPLPNQSAWPSIQWIVDLLPNFPESALNALDSYIQNFCQFLPDGRYTGLFDAKKIIQAKYMQHSLPVQETLDSLTWRNFEVLVAYLYNQKKYNIKLTKRTRDGGYDVIAEKNNDRESILLHIECKHSKKFVGVPIARQLMGTTVSKSVTKGILIASTYFTRPCIDYANDSKRLELINIDNFDYEMRKHIHYNWTGNIQDILKTAYMTLNINK